VAGPISAFNNQISGSQVNWQTWTEITCSGTPLLPTIGPRVIRGGKGPTVSPGQNGATGNAGSTGQAGSAGNTGQSSSALCNTFLGGAGGNAPPGGNAGNGGSGGQGGTGGPGPLFCRPIGSPLPGGSGGNGAGAGGINPGSPPSPAGFKGATGGGGAGAVNDGQSGFSKFNQVNCPSQNSNNNNFPSSFSQGGNDPGAIAVTLLPGPPGPPNAPLGFPINGSVNQTGGRGDIGASQTVGNVLATVHKAFYNPFTGQPIPCTNSPFIARGNRFINEPDSSNLWRAGGGGGASATTPGPSGIWGAGGGGGRGNAGNAGGPSPTISGSSANPATFNCVPVTPGGTAPITVGTPGGQIVISWNPQ
jgi:hypothetical protein